MNVQRKTFALFDFDGTISTQDTLLPFLRFAFPPLKYYTNLVLLVPFGLAYLLGFIDNEKVKTLCLGLFIKKMPISALEEKARLFALGPLNRYVRPKALERVYWHKKRGDRLFIVSANLELFLKFWAQQHDFDKVVATQLDVDSSKCATGKLKGKNCYGKEKVKRLQPFLNRANEYYYAYGDSRGDKELLEFADEGFYRLFP